MVSTANKNDDFSYVDNEKVGLPRPALAGKGKAVAPFSARAPRRSRAIVAIFFIGMLMVWTFHPRASISIRKFSSFPQPLQPLHEANSIAAKPVSSSASLVQLEAHIMSKCPDAQDCLVDLVVPAMERTAHMVDWKLSFIGEIDKDEGVHCKHGEEECLGNIMMLCAAKLYPDPKISLGFSTCLIKDYDHIPSRNLVENCALEHAVNFDSLNKCVSEDGDGMHLLKSSVTRSKDKGVKYSCTVRLDDKTRCIRDSGEWKDCEGGSTVDDLVRDITALYGASS